MGPAVQVVVDYALWRDEVDANRLAIYGFSWGGHIVLKGAQDDPRLRAVAANPAMPDVFRAALAQQSGQRRGDPASWMAFQQIAWRMGLKVSLIPADIARRFAKAYDYLVHGKADLSKLGCPVLCLAGEGEPQITLNIARECMARLPNPKKKLVIFTAEEGGEAHCQVNNPALPNRVLFDWLNEVFGEPAAAGPGPAGAKSETNEYRPLRPATER
jgi:dienelactone hydrolase